MNGTPNKCVKGSGKLLRLILLTVLLFSTPIADRSVSTAFAQASERSNSATSIFQRLKRNLGNVRERLPRRQKRETTSQVRRTTVRPQATTIGAHSLPRPRPDTKQRRFALAGGLRLPNFAAGSREVERSVTKPTTIVAPGQLGKDALILTNVSSAALKSRCPKRKLVGIAGVYAPHEVRLSPKASVQKPVGEALAKWLIESAQPAARKHLGSEIVRLQIAASFACRTRNNQSGAKLSEHGYGNAIDISVFTLANGQHVSVAQGWRGNRAEQRFLRSVNEGACAHFTTVLGPRSDRFHQDHFHFDLAKHGNSGDYRICK